MPLFIPITKVNVAQRLVYGTISEEVPDKTGEILDYESSRPAFEEWSRRFHEASGGKSLGNVRAMHGTIAAGKLTDISFDDENKRIEGVAKVVDEDTWQKVLEGVYTGFSIGGGYANRWPDKDNPALVRYTPTLSEVSLVDNPAVPTATFSVIKLDGSTEMRGFFAKADKAEEPEYSLDVACAMLNWLAGQVEDAESLEHIDALLAMLEGGSSERSAEVEKARVVDMHKYLQDTVQELKERLAKLEALPAAPKGVLRAVHKSHDYHDVGYLA